MYLLKQYYLYSKERIKQLQITLVAAVLGLFLLHHSPDQKVCLLEGLNQG